MRTEYVIYTFGYTLFRNRDDANVNVPEMLQALKALGVNALIDVRSVPYSQQAPACNADLLKISCAAAGLTYGHMPELGAKADEHSDVFSRAGDVFFEKEVYPVPKSRRPDDGALLPSDEIVDFGKMRASKLFLSGLERLRKGCRLGYRMALMCSEKSPVDCHRYFLISQAIAGDTLEESFLVNHLYRETTSGKLLMLPNADLDADMRTAVFRVDSIAKMRKASTEDIFSSDEHAPVSWYQRLSPYRGDTLSDKEQDFCLRYWNLLHGWRKTSYNPTDENNV
jgi:hypothetical protein